MNRSVAIDSEVNESLTAHLLQHARQGKKQEDLCFALWKPSTGATRYTAIVQEVVLPKDSERNLHRNASFNPNYLGRAVRLAISTGSGLAFMHSHIRPGWQAMSSADRAAEGEVIAYPAAATGLPLLGMTVGSDGYWSARFWKLHSRALGYPSSVHLNTPGKYTANMPLRTFDFDWCYAVRIVGRKRYLPYFNDHSLKPEPRRNVLKRTIDTWGTKTQNDISRLRIGIVGLGSVGSVVAEAMARIGIANITLIDHDRVEEHNLDRLLHATTDDIGQLKVDLVKRLVEKHATSRRVTVNAVPKSIHESIAYLAALDCDLLFSCVDRPVARDTLNFIAMAHLIPVIDGGVAVETDPPTDSLFSAHWRSHLVTPFHQCLRCNGQYSSGMVVAELDGSLDDPTYVKGLPPDQRVRNLNVFPFALGTAGMQVNLMIRYLVASDWWPTVSRQEFQLLTGEARTTNMECHPGCEFISRRGGGDSVVPSYLTPDPVSDR